VVGRASGRARCGAGFESAHPRTQRRSASPSEVMMSRRLRVGHSDRQPPRRRAPMQVGNVEIVWPGWFWAIPTLCVLIVLPSVLLFVLFKYSRCGSGRRYCAYPRVCWDRCPQQVCGPSSFRSLVSSGSVIPREAALPIGAKRRTSLVTIACMSGWSPRA
jgi:hypothetical protein